MSRLAIGALSLFLLLPGVPEAQASSRSDPLAGRGQFREIDALDEALERPWVAWRPPSAPPPVRGPATPEAYCRSRAPSRVTEPESIRRVILRNLGQVRRCYEQALRRQPGLTGRQVLRFVIDPVGHAREAAVVERTVPTIQLEACVMEALRTWDFVPPDGEAVVIYPFSFVPVERPVPAPRPTLATLVPDRALPDPYEYQQCLEHRRQIALRLLYRQIALPRLYR